MAKKQNKNYAKELKRISKEKSKKERFLTTRMWFSTFISFLFRDRGSIPANIGNNIQILNNEYITKDFISAVILIRNLTETTPVSFTSEIVRKLKSDTENSIPVLIDFTFKSRRKHYDMTSSGLQSRIKTWTATLDHPFISPATKRICARLLYTVDIVKQHIPVFTTRLYITVRSKTGADLNRGLEGICEYLDSIGAEYRVIRNDMSTHVEYIGLASSKVPKNIKDIPYLITSPQTLAEMLPTIQGMNDFSGICMGIDRETNNPYYIDFSKIKNARNIVVAGLSGYGKTFIVNNWMLDFFVMSYNIIGNDIKGNELIHFAEATGGIVFDCTAKSRLYINTFKLHPEEIIGDDSRYCYDERLGWSKEFLCNLTGFVGDRLSRAEALFEEFLRSLYNNLGVLADNPNTWKRTAGLNPFIVFEHFRTYCSENVRARYSDIIDIIISRLKIFLTPEGSNSHMFTTEVSIDNIVTNKVIIFNFGMIDGSTSQTTEMFNVHFQFSTIIKQKFIYKKFSNGEFTVNIDEESNSVPDTTLIEYSKDFTLRRAQNCVNIILCNSLTALESNPKAKGIIDNINLMCAGVMHRKSREILVEEFGLDEYEEIIRKLGKDSEMDNTFILVNNMQKNAPTPLLKVYVPDRVVKGRFFQAAGEGD